MFLTPAGAPYYDSGGRGGSPIKRAFKGACGRAGIRGLRVHDLRHSFASWLVMSGVPLRSVAELFGHIGASAWCTATRTCRRDICATPSTGCVQKACSHNRNQNNYVKGKDEFNVRSVFTRRGSLVRSSRAHQ